ncbi:probable cytochrome P450 6a14 [Leguminivora glycinivorella]|uniref:probable cytochrome P450 6a14 n=1 Tax=Leguminivora glycinivorella TaxID=1035111 RepID=UPI00200D4C24|nr:probable cytochrome P450 6a14 [Leguminivora glycinivorella]
MAAPAPRAVRPDPAPRAPGQNILAPTALHETRRPRPSRSRYRLYAPRSDLISELEQLVEDPSELYTDREQFEGTYYHELATARELLERHRSQRAKDNASARSEVGSDECPTVITCKPVLKTMGLQRREYMVLIAPVHLQTLDARTKTGRPSMAAPAPRAVRPDPAPRAPGQNILLDQLRTYFYRRGVGRNPELEPLHASLFHIDGDRWKLTRQLVAPAFTSARLKAMFPLVARCAERLQGAARAAAARPGSGVVDARDLMARFTTDFIAACGFGVDTNSLDDEHSHFRKLGRLFFTKRLSVVIRFTMWELFPPLRRYIRVVPENISEAFCSFVKKVRKDRQCKPCGRNDFIDLLLELERKGKIVGESIEHHSPDGTPVTVEMEMDLKMMVAQAFLFFIAGFETSSSATSYTLHELAFNPELQLKIQLEIDEVLRKYDNKLCYDAVAEMKLLSMAFKEAMRIFPPGGVLLRVCARPYTFPELGMTVDPGVRIVIPMQALQNDEKYFDSPQNFQPDRFDPEKVKQRHKYVYLPFGDGPRSCVASRLGEMQSLAGLAAVLRACSVSPASTTRRVPRVDSRVNTVQCVRGGLPLQFTVRDQ